MLVCGFAHLCAGVFPSLPYHHVQDIDSASMASSSALLPKRESETAFAELVMDRQSAFMTMEIVRIRDALLGSDALIAEAKASPGINILADVLPDEISSFIMRNNSLFLLLPAQVAWGDACMRFSGLLPPVAPFAAEQPSLAACKKCICRGKFARKDIFSVLRAQHKPDWSAFLRYMAAQRASGQGISQSADELEAALVKLNERLLSTMESYLTQVKFPHQTLQMIRDEAQLYKFVQTLRRPSALTNALVEALSDGDPFTYSLPHLVLLRSCGRFVREHIAQMHCQLGDAYLESAVSKSDPNAFVLADKEWTCASAAGGFHAAVSLYNLTKLLLEQKK